MKSIEERAWDYAVQYRQGDSVFAEGYIQGAKEQRAIDIENACEWLKLYCGMNESGLVQFRKAMED